MQLKCWPQQAVNKTISNKVLRKIKAKKNKLTAVYFLEPSCPISQKYQNKIKEIDSLYQHADLKSVFIYPNSFSKKQECIKFGNDVNKYSRNIFDRKKDFSKHFEARITPEVFLVNIKGEIIYQGAIDNWFYALGRARKETDEFYLINAIKNSLSLKTISPNKTEAIGCDIE